MKKLLLFPLILWGNFAFSQLNETFNDGNFTSTPVWSGSNSGNDFNIVTEQLRSNSITASSNFYLSTANNLAANCQWEFWVNLQFNTSGANYVDVYLTSDQSNLQAASINGYFVRLGNTNDEICLFKRSGTTASSTKLIDGIDGILNTSNNKVKIRVTRTASNVFTLERDITGLGTSFITEGTFQDASFTTSGYFGIFIQQSTSSFFQKHFFDDFKISALNTDTSPPKLLSATVIDSTSLEILFDEPVDSVTAKSVINYSINNNYGNPISVKTTADASKYILTLSKGLSTAFYLLTVSNIKDKAGNLISSDNTATFSFIKPFQAMKGDLIINEIFADPSPQIDLPSVEFIELFNTTNQTFSLKNWKYSDPASTATLPADSIKSGEYLILCAKADTTEFKRFGKTIGISPWPTLNNASDIIKLVSPENKTIDSVAYSDTWYPTAIKKQGGWSLERINNKSICTGLFNWTAAKDSTGGTPGKQNSVFIPNYDQLAFRADSLQYLSDSTLNVYFNKPADISTQNNAFNLSPLSGNLKSLIFDSNSKQVKLTFSSKFSANTSYQLNVSQLKDCAGNTIDPNSFQFTTPKLPLVRLDTAKISITEIFADPSPEIKLPLVEFVEIHNSGKDTIDLDGWTLNNSKTKTSIRKNTILPNEYLILCPAGDTTQFKPFGKVIGLSPWPALTNAADQIVLKSFKGRLSDSVAYADSWHANSTKKQGGWSLERIDYASVCGGMLNWSSSTDTSGGTPGEQNSVFIPNFDKMAFKADSLKRLTDSTLTVFFNKAIDGSTASNAFSINPGSGSLKSTAFNTNLKQVTLLFNQSFLSNTSYQLTISNLKDCSGNLAVYASQALQFTTPKLPPIRLDTASLYITEIFADPSPEVKLPLVEFVELYNPGKDTIDLDGWTFNSSRTKSTIRKTSILPNEYLILCSAADTLQYKSFGKVAGLSPWPSLANASDQVTLKSFKGRLVDSVSYSDNWHSSTSKKQGGWSLERVDYKSVCTGLFNWASSIDVSGGTPGKQNSVKVANYDKLAFKADSIQQVSDTVIHVYFNKHIDISSAKNAFNLNSAGGSVKSVAFDVMALKAILICEKFTPDTMYQVSISQLKDCAGNSISPGTLTFNTPKLLPARLDTAKLYITEIFTDPSPEIKLPLVEFVEIYNPGKDTIDLEGWSFTNSKTKASFKNIAVSPNQYLILCPAADTLQYKPFGKVAGLSPWPSLTNASDQVTLKSFKGRLVDSVSYSDAWHGSSSKKQGGWSLERLDYKSVCTGLFNWASSTDPLGGTPGKLNSIYIWDYDKLAFKGDSIKQLSDTSINVYFNKHIDISNTANAFKLNPATNIKSVTFDAQVLKATLICEKFAANTIYQLIVQLKDCAGNSIIQSPSLTFNTPKLPRERLDTARLFITEIFSDPSPEVKLPLVEFVEIFNPGKDTIDLAGWSLNDPTNKAIFKKASILPQQYLILCPAADTLTYKPFGKTIGLAPWPALNNSLDQITLKSFTGRLIDSVSYHDSWYKNAVKKAGGWSLELIDNKSICQGNQNWMASTDISGGTPGRQNSVHQLFNSLEALKITTTLLKDSTTIFVSFNRPPDSLFTSNPSNYLVNNGVGQPSAISLNSSFNEAELKFAKPIARGNTYKITCSNITDCAGAIISSANNSAEFFYPHKILKGDILISEVLFNPRVGGSDFVEIYNNSANTLDLKELSIATIKAPDSIASRKSLSTASLSLLPRQHMVLTIDPENIKAEYHTENPQSFLKMASLPAFSNEQGTVVLLSGESRIDQFEYNEKMHFPLIKDPKGISLERSLFNRPANEPGNFRSAAGSVGYATPGYKNSQTTDTKFIFSEEISLLSKSFSPDNDGFEDALQINYQFKDAGMVANVSIYNDKGILIKRLTKNTTLAAEGTVVWDGITENEQRAPVGVYIVYFDVFNLNGQSKKYKKACVLASKLN